MKYLVVLIFINVSLQSLSQTDIYYSVINASHGSQYSEVTRQANQIINLPLGSKRNDLLVALAYAELNLFQFGEFEETLKKITSPNAVQTGSINQLYGLYYLIKQKYKKASTHFKLAIDAFDQAEKNILYYEACNNLAHSHIQLHDENQFTNVLLDGAIEFAEQNGDSLLLSRALINRSQSYPENALATLAKAYQIGTKGVQSTAAFFRAKQTNDNSLLEYALQINPFVDYTSPAPLKMNERAEIILSLARLEPETNKKESLRLLNELKKDSLWLPEALYNRVLKAISIIYERNGQSDSAAYFLLKIKTSDIEQPDTLRENLPDILGQISHQDKKKSYLLAAAILMSIVTVTLLYFLIKSFRVVKA